MNVQELQDKKLVLEKELLNLIGEKLEKFRKETGVYIEDVSIEMYNVTTRGELIKGKSSYMLVGVRCNITI